MAHDAHRRWGAVEERWRPVLWAVATVCLGATLVAAFVDQVDPQYGDEVAAEGGVSDSPVGPAPDTPSVEAEDWPPRPALEVRIIGGAGGERIEVLADDTDEVVASVEVDDGVARASDLEPGGYVVHIWAEDSPTVTVEVQVADGVDAAVTCDLGAVLCAGTSSASGTITG